MSLLLRAEPERERLRLLVRRRRVEPAEALKGAFMADGGGIEYRALVRADCRVIAYQRPIVLHCRGRRALVWRDRKYRRVALAEYSQLAVALGMDHSQRGTAFDVGSITAFRSSRIRSSRSV